MKSLQGLACFIAWTTAFGTPLHAGEKHYKFDSGVEGWSVPPVSHLQPPTGSGGVMTLVYADVAPPTAWNPIVWNSAGDLTGSTPQYLVVRTRVSSGGAATPGQTVTFLARWKVGTTFSATYERTFQVEVDRDEFQTFIFDMNDPLATSKDPDLDAVTFPSGWNANDWPQATQFGVKAGVTTADQQVLGAVGSEQKVEFDTIAVVSNYLPYRKQIYADYILVFKDRYQGNYPADSFSMWGFDTDFIDVEGGVVKLSRDLYMSSDRREISGTYYPETGLYDTLDPDMVEYQVLLARATGFDGFLGEWVSNCNGNEHQDDALFVLANACKKYDLKTGIIWNNQSHWNDLDAVAIYDVAAECTKFTNRDQGMTEARDRLSELLGAGSFPERHLYTNPDYNGALVMGRPLVTLFAVFTDQPPSIADDALGFYPSEIAQLRAGLPSNPWIVARNRAPFGADAGLYNALDGSWFCLPVTANEQAMEPFTDVKLVDELIGQLRVAQSAAAALKSDYASSGNMQLLIGSTFRGFDDHKGHTWTNGKKSYVQWAESIPGAGSTLQRSFDELAQFKDEAGNEAGLAIFFTWNSYKEGTHVEPTREFGFDDLEALQLEIAAWKNESPPSPSLLQFPRAILNLRRVHRWLKGLGDTNTNLDPLNTKLGLAAEAVAARDESSANTHLSDARSLAAPLVESVHASRVRFGWEVGSGPQMIESGIQLIPSEATTFVNKGGQYGVALQTVTGVPNQQLHFKVTDTSFLSRAQAGSPVDLESQNARFQGRVTVEYWQESVNDEVDYIEISSLSPGANALQARFRLRDVADINGDLQDPAPGSLDPNAGTDQRRGWVRAEADLLNVTWAGGSHVRVVHKTQFGPSPSAVRSVRIDGFVYGLTTQPPASSSFALRAGTLVKAFGGPGNDYAHDVHVLSDGDILVTGEFWGQMTIGNKTLNSEGEADMFLVRMSSSGSTVKWALKGGGAYSDRGLLLVVDEGNGRVQVGGTCFGRMKFVSAPSPVAVTYQTVDPSSTDRLKRSDAREAEETQFLATYRLLDGKLLPPPGHTIAAPLFDRTLFGDRRIAELAQLGVPDGHVLTGKYFLRKRMSEDGVLGEDGVLVSQGEEDMFVAEYGPYSTSLPSLRWMGTGGGAENDAGVAVSVGGDVAVVVGVYRGTATFGAGQSTPPSNGGTDVFVVKYQRSP